MRSTRRLEPAALSRDLSVTRRLRLTLLRVGFTDNDVSAAARALLPHAFTLALRAVGQERGLLSVALSLRLPPPAVSRHPAVWSPDFPLSTDPYGLESGHPATRCFPVDDIEVCPLRKSDLAASLRPSNLQEQSWPTQPQNLRPQWAPSK